MFTTIFVYNFQSIIYCSTDVLAPYTDKKIYFNCVVHIRFFYLLFIYGCAKHTYTHTIYMCGLCTDHTLFRNKVFIVNHVMNE